MNILSKFIGNTGEKYAENFLKKSGYRILKRQHKVKYVEIDIIAKKESEIYLFEVKTVSRETLERAVSHETQINNVSHRNNLDSDCDDFYILERVYPQKLEKMRRFGEYYLNKHPKYHGIHLGIIIVKLVENEKKSIVKLVLV